jgi:hypothetical protein
MITRCQPGIPIPLPDHGLTGAHPASVATGGIGRAAGLTPRDQVRRSAASGDDDDSTSSGFPLPAHGRRPIGARPHVRDAVRRAGFVWVTSHVFRKTAITVLDQAGLNARAIAGHSGHSRPSMTQDVYMDRRADGRQAADALDAAMGFMRPRVWGE